MHRLLLVTAASLAAIVIPTATAQARDFSSSGFRGHHGDRGGFVSRDGRGFDCDVREDRRGRHDGRRDGRRDRRSGDCVFVGGNLGYLDYGDYDANRSFDPDLWNDWWHERPWRAYPRWVQEARGRENCDPDRMWWSGTGWHC